MPKQDLAGESKHFDILLIVLSFESQIEVLHLYATRTCRPAMSVIEDLEQGIHEPTVLLWHLGGQFMMHKLPHAVVRHLMKLGRCRDKPEERCDRSLVAEGVTLAMTALVFVLSTEICGIQKWVARHRDCRFFGTSAQDRLVHQLLGYRVQGVECYSAFTIQILELPAIHGDL